MGGIHAHGGRLNGRGERRGQIMAICTFWTVMIVYNVSKQKRQPGFERGRLPVGHI